MLYVDHLSWRKINAYIDEELESRERSEVEDHLETCNKCAKRIEIWSRFNMEFYSKSWARRPVIFIEK